MSTGARAEGLDIWQQTLNLVYVLRISCLQIRNDYNVDLEIVREQYIIGGVNAWLYKLQIHGFISQNNPNLLQDGPVLTWRPHADLSKEVMLCFFVYVYNIEYIWKSVNCVSLFS